MATRKTIGRDIRDERAWRQFAAAALVNSVRHPPYEVEIAKSAAKIADAMLKEFQARTPVNS